MFKIKSAPFGNAKSHRFPDLTWVLAYEWASSECKYIFQGENFFSNTLPPPTLTSPPSPSPILVRRRNSAPNVNPSSLGTRWCVCLGDSLCSWLAGVTFCVWWLAVSSGPAPLKTPLRLSLPAYCLEVLRYWFPARARCLTCQSMVRTVGCHWEQARDVWCLADV